MQKELEIGCNECPEVKAGFIGEVGSTWPIEGKNNRILQFIIAKLFKYFNYLATPLWDIYLKQIIVDSNNFYFSENNNI